MTDTRKIHRITGFLHEPLKQLYTNVVNNLKETDKSLDINIQQILNHEEREIVNGPIMNNKIDS